MRAFLASMMVCALAGVPSLRAQAVNEVQHRNLPSYAASVTFLKYTGTDAVGLVRDQDMTYNPGTWSDVRILSWNPPLTTISGYQSGVFRITHVHILSFPPDKRAGLADAAKAAKPVLASDADKDSVLLKDGRILRHAVMLRATPEGALIKHDGGTDLVPPANLTPDFHRNHRPFGRFLYFAELPLADGAKLTAARVGAIDAENCRIAHAAGVLAVPLASLPEEAQALVRKYLIEPRLFATEVLTDPASRSKPAPRAAQSRPTPTPAPVLQKTSPGHYAVLPLAGGLVLRDVSLLSVGETVVHYQETGKEPRFASWKDFPAEVRDELALDLYPTLIEILRHGVVSSGRSPIYALAGNERVEKEIDFETEAKEAGGGRIVARVGRGFVVIAAKNKAAGGAAVRLPKPLAGLTRGFVTPSDFAHLGPPSWRKWWSESGPDPLPEVVADDAYNRVTFAPVVLDPDAVLLDAFDPRFTLLGNRQGVMRRAWRVEPAAHPGFALVETDAGFYFGVLTRVEKLAETQMTWEQLVAQRSGVFALEKTGQKTVRPDATLLQVNDSGPLASRLMLSPGGLRVYPSHHRIIVDKGMSGLITALEASQTDTVELAASNSTETFEHKTETEIERLTVQLNSVSADSVFLKVISQVRERKVDRAPGPWKSRKEEKIFELPRDPDGGIRLTDGNTIYELAFPKVGGAQFTTYVPKENALSKAPR